MGADGAQVNDTAVGCLTAVVAEPVGLPPAPQPQVAGDATPTAQAAKATVEQTGADPPPRE
jgi:hypothetical protein